MATSKTGADPVAPTYAYALNDGVIMWGGGGNCITTRRGEVWFLDDPFVQDRRDLFSAEPPVVHSTASEGRPQHEARPLSETRKARRG